MTLSPNTSPSPRSTPPTSPTPPSVAIVVAQYNASVTHALRDGAIAAYAQAGGNPNALLIVEAPGAFELPVLCAAAARSGRCAGVVALGCLIEGETSHADHIGSAVADGLVQVGLQTGVPVTFGVLTVQTAEQATARAGGGEGNKGSEAMRALLETLAATAAITRGDAAVRCASPKPDKAVDTAAVGR